MEEIQCLLLCYRSGSVEGAGAAVFLDAMHPTEAALVGAALPLGDDYGFLKRFCEQSTTAIAAERPPSLYAASIALGVRGVLERYEADVLALVSPSDLLWLRLRYEDCFARLVRTASASNVCDRIALVCDFVGNQEVPLENRISVGGAVSMALLFHIAHWVAHGELLEVSQAEAFGLPCRGRVRERGDAIGDDGGGAEDQGGEFFICPGEATPVDVECNADRERHGLQSGSGEAAMRSRRSRRAFNAADDEVHIDAQCLPPFIPERLAVAVLLAGKERATLLKERRLMKKRVDEEGASAPVAESTLPSSSSDGVGAAEDSGNAIFHTIYNPSLCREGIIRVDELEIRIDAAKRMWSRSLWSTVSATSQLQQHLAALHDMFLCRRGDLWHTFVELAFPTLCAPPAGAGAATATSAAATHGITPLQCARAVRQSFSAALAMTSCGELPIHSRFVIDYEGTAAGGVGGGSGVGGRSATASQFSTSSSSGGRPEEIGSMLLQRVKRISLSFALPYGVHLVVTEPSLLHYRRLFTLHMLMRFVMLALQYCRRFIGELSRSVSGSRALGRVSAALHTLTFVQANLSYFLQVDVQDTHFAAMMKKMGDVKSVEAATKHHTHFIHEVMAGSFFADETTDISATTEHLFVLAFALFVLCSRDDAAGSIEHRMTTEFSLGLSAIESRIKRELPSLQLQLSISAQKEHRALWTRLDFNRFFSSSAFAGSASSAPAVAGRSKAAS